MRNILLTISLLICAQVIWANTDDFDDTKVVKKSFKASKDFELDIQSKHGIIDIETWSKDSVAVIATVRVESQKLDRLQTIMDQINIRFTNHDDYLAIITEWGSSSNGLRVDFMKIFDAQSVRVDYKIMVPKGIEMDIENKYGDIILGNCSGKLKIDLAYGNFTARDISNAQSINIQYGKLKVKTLEKGDIISRFSNISIDEAGQIDMDATSSDIEIDKIKSLKIKSVGDKIEIESIDELTIYASLSNIEIEQLTGTVNGTIKYGDFEIEEVFTSFKGIKLEGQSTDIQIYFQSAIAYNYYVQMEKGKSFSIPAEGNSLSKDEKVGEISTYEGLFATIPVGGKPANVTLITKVTYIKLGIK